MRIFAPSVSCHEWPLGKSIAAVIVVGSATEDHGTSAHRRNKEHFHIATTSRVETDNSLDVFQVVDFRLRTLTITRIQRKSQCAVSWYRSVQPKRTVTK